MPTGETPQPQFKRGEDLAFGEAHAANSLMGLVGPPDQLEPHQPTSPQEQFVLSPTDRPNEPITAGVPFGPGADGVTNAGDDPNVFRQRVMDQLATQPGASKEVRALAKRMQAGL
jgi:hypothetical protein